MSIIEKLREELKREIEATDRIIFEGIDTKEKTIGKLAGYLLDSGGKRIRPLLTVLCAKIFGRVSEESLKFAAAVEFIHTATLLHDDVIDESETRRSKPTANRVWGSKAAILVGDFLFSKAFGLMVEARSKEALDSLAKAAAIISEGEVSQLARLKEKRFLTEKEYSEIIEAKTAALFGSSCEVGALSGGASPAEASLLFDFGYILGQIFQISDDLLDYFGDENSTGKTSGRDFFEGKVTLPLIFLKKNLAGGEATELEKFLKADIRNQEELAWVKKSLLEHKIPELVRNYLETLKDKADSLILRLGRDDIYKKYLSGLTSFAIERTH